jgi:hypothetical protein
MKRPTCIIRPQRMTKRVFVSPCGELVTAPKRARYKINVGRPHRMTFLVEAARWLFGSQGQQRSYMLAFNARSWI